MRGLYRRDLADARRRKPSFAARIVVSYPSPACGGGWPRAARAAGGGFLQADPTPARLRSRFGGRPSPFRGGIRKRASIIARILCGAGDAVVLARRSGPFFRPQQTPRGWSAGWRYLLSSCRALFWRTRAPLGAPWRRLFGAGPRFRQFLRLAFGPQARPLLGSRTFAPRASRAARRQRAPRGRS